MVFKKNNKKNSKGNLNGKPTEYRADGVKRPSRINAVGVMALATVSAAVSFGIAFMLFNGKLIGIEQVFDVGLIGPVLFCIWLLLRG